jgi:hypothetical protein
LDTAPSASGERAANVAGATAATSNGTASLQAVRLELSGNIALHSLQLFQATGPASDAPVASANFAVDIMDDATRMSYGFRQTSVLLRALRSARSVRMQLGLRRPDVMARSDALDLSGLASALRALEDCQQKAMGKVAK